MHETAYQNLHCDTQLNVTFGVIVLTLLIALMAVSVSIRTSAERKYHKVAAMFVHSSSHWSMSSTKRAVSSMNQAWMPSSMRITRPLASP
ncbi:hypothetical protein ACV1EH_02225 [Aeromonas caviae]